VSSRCGSSDLLEAAGVRIELDADQARTVLEEVGITYLHAPSFHPLMRFAGPVRRALGVRTVFNLLGPLCNPGRVRRQLLGVADPTRVADFAAVLAGLGHTRAYVVHGGGGADELTLAPGNVAATVGDAPTLVLDARALGLDVAPVSALAGAGDAAANLAQLAQLFAGDGGPLRDALLLNAAVALVVAGLATDAAHGVACAAEVLDSGAAAAKLATWAALTQAVAA
jgi:anthranilate phosphoribosyltransferase